MSAGRPTDHYAVLGVEPGTDAAGVRRAFRRLSRAHHPDLGGDPTRYETITVAYTVLSDPRRRAEYDRSLGGSTGTQARSARAQGGARPAGTAPSRTAPSGTRAPRTPSASTRPRPAAPGPGRRPVRVVGQDGSPRPAQQAATLVHGRLPRRGVFDRNREVRSSLVTDLFERLLRRLPAARLFLGVKVDGWPALDAVVCVDGRLAVLTLVHSADVAHTWDGRTLRAAGRPVAVPDTVAAAAALERAVGGSRAEGLAVVFTSPDLHHSPVVERIGSVAAPTGPLNPSRASGEIAAFLAGAADPDTVRLTILERLADLSATRR